MAVVYFVHQKVEMGGRGHDVLIVPPAASPIALGQCNRGQRSTSDPRPPNCY